MPDNRQLDAYEFSDLYLPYNRTLRELSEDPRLVRGSNSYVTLGGKLTKRPGTLQVTSTAYTSRTDRLWVYETLETPPNVYILRSRYNTGTSKWVMEYINLDAGSPAWTSMGSTRDLNASIYPHELTVSRGLAYIKAFPASGSSEKLGSVIFDGTGGTPVVKLWGLMGPTVPARISGRVTHLVNDITDTTSPITVTADFSPPVATPFTIQVEYEQMTVTLIGGGGTTWTVTRGVNGTTADSHPDGTPIIYRDWSASAHRVDVNIGWVYSYAWKTSTGQISCRADVESNPDLMPSATGPFFDLRPKITVQGHADTTNITKVVIYRTLDGGGQFFKLDEVTNTGAGAITYEDKNLESGTGGGTFADPIPDEFVDVTDVAPSLTSHGPPPTVVAPQVVGTDAPKRSTPLATYAQRIWFAIDNVLFYSGQEEIAVGIPEESFPAGIRGNFFRMYAQILNLRPTEDALYITTTGATYQLTGTNQETFTIRPLFNSVGSPYGHPRAMTVFGNNLAWLTHDYRIAISAGSDIRFIQTPLYTDLIDAINAGGEIELTYFGDLDKDWIIVSSHRTDDTTASQQWVYDLKLSEMRRADFWNTPWSIRSTAVLSTRLYKDQLQRRLVFAIWDGTNGRLVRLDPTMRTATDVTPAGGTTGFTFNAETHLFRVPPGNHVNALRVPGLSSVLHAIQLERTLFLGDTDPRVYYYADDFWTTPRPLTPAVDPARRDQSRAYKTLVYTDAWQALQRVGLKLTKVDSKELFELQGLSITFAPDSGA